MIKELSHKTKDAKIRIVRFLSTGEIVLKSDEEKILKRWMYANDLMTAKEKSWPEIVNDIAETFAISKYTAESDISAAQEVFGTLRKIDKKYLLHLHIERIDRQIKLITDSWKDEEGKPIELDSKEIIALAKMNDSYTYALNSIPAYVEARPIQRPVFFITPSSNSQITNTLPINIAMKMADDIIDITHEESNDTEILPEQ